MGFSQKMPWDDFLDGVMKIQEVIQRHHEVTSNSQGEDRK